MIRVVILFLLAIAFGIGVLFTPLHIGWKVFFIGFCAAAAIDNGRMILRVLFR